MPTLNQVHVQKVPLFIGGKFVESANGGTFENTNPATNEVIAAIAEASFEDVDRAARAARAAFESGAWSRMPAAGRAKTLREIADVIESPKAGLAILECIDTGKPIREALAADIPRTASYFRIFSDYI